MIWLNAKVAADYTFGDVEELHHPGLLCGLCALGALCVTHSGCEPHSQMRFPWDPLPLLKRIFQSGRDPMEQHTRPAIDAECTHGRRPRGKSFLYLTCRQRD